MSVSLFKRPPVDKSSWASPSRRLPVDRQRAATQWMHPLPPSRPGPADKILSTAITTGCKPTRDLLVGLFEMTFAFASFSFFPLPSSPSFYPFLLPLPKAKAKRQREMQRRTKIRFPVAGKTPSKRAPLATHLPATVSRAGHAVMATPYPDGRRPVTPWQATVAI